MKASRYLLRYTESLFSENLNIMKKTSHLLWRFKLMYADKLYWGKEKNVVASCGNAAVYFRASSNLRTPFWSNQCNSASFVHKILFSTSKILSANRPIFFFLFKLFYSILKVILKELKTRNTICAKHIKQHIKDMNFSSYAPPLPLALTLQSVCNNFVNS